MNPIVCVENVSFCYAGLTNASLCDITLSVSCGDFLLLTGETGCGKSTLLKTMNGLIPHESGGTLTGKVTVNEQYVVDSSVAELSKTVGMVFQSPEDQIFSTTVFDEVAFVLENRNIDAKEIAARVTRTLADVGLNGLENRSIHALSGGQKQRLALAAILVANPRILLLDEPISQLDPQGAADLLAVVSKLNQAGITIIMVEHRLHEVMPLCKHIAVMKDGQLVWYGSQEEAFQNPQIFHQHGLRMPHTIELCHALAINPENSTIEAAVRCIRERFCLRAERAVACKEESLLLKKPEDTKVVEAKKLNFRYAYKGQNIIDQLDLTIRQGEFVILMGRNGAGKSTLLQMLCGLTKPTGGKVLIDGRELRGISCEVGFVMQNPDLMLFNVSVQKEIEFAVRQQNGQVEIDPAFIQSMGLAGLEQCFPLSLSRGQRFRVAIAAALAVRPKILLLDEPTTGQDIAHIREVIAMLNEYIASGGTVVFCTHDAEVAAAYAQRIIVMREGKIILDGPPASVFAETTLLESTGIKPPQISLVSQELYGACALTVEEAVKHVRQIDMGGPAA